MVMDVIVPVNSFCSVPLINGRADGECLENSVIGGFATKESNSFLVSTVKNVNYCDVHADNKKLNEGVETLSGEPCLRESSCLGDAPPPLAMDLKTSSSLDPSPKALAGTTADQPSEPSTILRTDLNSHSIMEEMIVMPVQTEVFPASHPIQEIEENCRNMQELHIEREGKEQECLRPSKCDDPYHVICVCLDEAIQPLAADVVSLKPLDNSFEALARTNLREPLTNLDVKDLSHHSTNGVIFMPVQVEAFPTPPLTKDSSKNTKDFNNDRDENKEHDYFSGNLEPIKVRAQQIKKASRSLRALLSLENSFAGDGDEKGTSPNVKDSRSDHGMETFADTRLSTAKKSSSANQLPTHIFTERWYDHLDKEEYALGTFSGPIGFSGPIISTGAGPFPHSGSISHRSDSSTSTRSFAFPILASEWNTSPATMGQPSSHYFRRRRKSRFCACCRRPSTSFD